MSDSARVSSALRYLSLAAMATVLAGCASTSQNAAPATASAESPAAASQVVDTADFTKRAQDDGWNPVIRNGQVLYCKDEAPLDSRFPERKCLNKAGVEQMMLAEQHQRDSMRHAYNGVGMPP
jgi:PBP1b-binding outer membrane lipoprotein LpoB